MDLMESLFAAESLLFQVLHKINAEIDDSRFSKEEIPRSYLLLTSRSLEQFNLIDIVFS